MGGFCGRRCLPAHGSHKGPPSAARRPPPPHPCLCLPAQVDVLLAQPLRLGAMAEEGRLDLSGVRLLVLDEADKLFDLGFTRQVDAVVAACSHRAVVRALFSATLPEAVEALARSVLRDPLRITVGERNTGGWAGGRRPGWVGGLACSPHLLLRLRTLGWPIVLRLVPPRSGQLPRSPIRSVALPPPPPCSRVQRGAAPAVCGAGGGQAAGAAAAGGAGAAPAGARVCGHQGASQGAAQVGAGVCVCVCVCVRVCCWCFWLVCVWRGMQAGCSLCSRGAVCRRRDPCPDRAQLLLLCEPAALLAAWPCRELMYEGVHVDSIHADQSQAARQAAVDNFRCGAGGLAGLAGLGAGGEVGGGGLENSAPFTLPPSASSSGPYLCRLELSLLARLAPPAWHGPSLAAQGGAHVGADCHRPHRARHGLSGSQHRGQL